MVSRSCLSLKCSFVFPSVSAPHSILKCGIFRSFADLIRSIGITMLVHAPSLMTHVIPSAVC